MIQIYTDGACKGNPGPGGWGAVICGDSGEYHISGGEKHTTNNQMELIAIIKALESVGAPNVDITLYTDSEYVQKGITQWIHNWKRNGWRTANRQPVKNQDLWIKLDVEASKHKIDWRWIKGHNGCIRNEIADKLAVNAIPHI